MSIMFDFRVLITSWKFVIPLQMRLTKKAQKWYGSTFPDNPMIHWNQTKITPVISRGKMFN